MKKLVSVSFSPNVQADDVWFAFRLLCCPWKWVKGQSRSALEEAVKTEYGALSAFAFESGRTCLFKALQALGIGKDDEVLLQAYTCTAVPGPVCWTGATPVFVDCEEDSFCMDPEDFKQKITSKSKAVIVQHTFGAPAKIDQILKIARDHGLVVIEDCAHALGTTYQGRALGTWGDVSFISFGRDKPLSSVFGGVVFTANKDIATKIQIFYDASPEVRYLWVQQQLLHPLIFALSLPLYYVLGVGKALLGLSRHLHLLSRAVTEEERRGEMSPFVGHKMPNALACLALNQWRKRRTYISRRKYLAGLYHRRLQDKTMVCTLPFLSDEISYLRYPLLVNDPKGLLLRAKQQGMLLGDWYTDAIGPDGASLEKVGYIPGACPCAEQKARHSVNLPTHVNVTDHDAQRVIEFLLKEL